MWWIVLRRASSPVAVPPWDSRMVRGYCGIAYKARCWYVSFEGNNVGGSDILVRYSMLWSLNVHVGTVCGWVGSREGGGRGLGVALGDEFVLVS